MNKLEYYRLEGNDKDREFYFANEGIFNFWDEYLIVHIRNVHILVVNRTGREFTIMEITKLGESSGSLKQEVKERFCGARNCCCENVECQLFKDWGNVICRL